MNGRSLASLRLATALFLGTVVALAPAAATYAAKEKGPSVSRELLKPLKDAQELAGKGEFPAAEAELLKANAEEKKTPYDQFVINELLGFVYLKEQKINEAAAAFEDGLKSGLLPAEEVNKRLHLLSQIFLQTKPQDLAKASDYGKRWLQATGTRDPAMLGQIGHIAYLSNNYQEAITYVKEAVDLTKAAGQKPDQNWLLIEQSAYAKLNDNAGIVAAAMDLAQYYPTRDHWQVLLDNELAQAKNDDSRIIQVFRLMEAVGNMDDADSIREAASVAMRRGFPGEAVHYLAMGDASGILAKSGDQAKSKALQADAQRQATADRKSLPQIEKEAIAAKAGEADVKLGETLLGYDQPAKALEALQRGIGKGGVKNLDEAELALGRAYLLSGNKAEALKSFAKVTSPGFAQLAKLWTIHVGQL